MADHVSGGTTYTDEQKRAVIAFLSARSASNPTSYAEVQEKCHIRERALRAMLSDLDGTLVDGWAFVLAFNEPHTAFWLAGSADEARATTRRLRHQAFAMNCRADRREQAYSKLGEPQGALL